MILRQVKIRCEDRQVPEIVPGKFVPVRCSLPDGMIEKERNEPAVQYPGKVQAGRGNGKNSLIANNPPGINGKTRYAEACGK